MKRTAEFVLGLVGGILGILLSLVGFFFSFIGFLAEDPGPASVILIITFVFFVIQLAALIMSCLVNRMDHKLYGGLMITWGVLSFPVAIFLMFVPSILYIIAGALGLRKLDAGNMEFEKTFI
ncbi:magnesium-transporting ATPase (P-type) [Cytobacillus eiseniae]|uniref:Magnesium-transporting ATPase (P-type) n=1 Tax=Cytobacillus eiseniae TaxID=762947 RepID=A0ABS4RH45_9BACI|nr:DUF4064 domain-containing protein [Cytobacillus eiseniae]MBP2241751.1 magnesium-transporting ATPase (P-type) [Cytobacillus eiseniae]